MKCKSDGLPAKREQNKPVFSRCVHLILRHMRCKCVHIDMHRELYLTSRQNISDFFSKIVRLTRVKEYSVLAPEPQ